MDQNNQNNENRKNIVDKVAGGGRASMSDQSLTPPRKIEAELKRMQNPTEHENRGEEDRQVASLGGAILTPQKKMERARLESQAKLNIKTEDNQ